MRLFPQPPAAPTMRRYQSQHADHLRPSALALAPDDGTETNLIKVYPDVLRQEVLGFGVAVTQASAHVFAGMPEDAQERLLDACFGPDGAGYTLCRTPIMSCDFSTAPYDYHSGLLDAGNRRLDFSADDAGIVPVLRRIRDRRPELELVATPWSPPAYMKTTLRRTFGGRLRPAFHQRWADLMARYVEHMGERGIAVTRLTVQNEPEAVQTWESCLMDGRQEARFATEALRPALECRGLGRVRILGWDHNKQRAVERARTAFEDADNPDALDGLALHWYAGDHFEAVRHVRDTWPHKELLATEACEAFRGSGRGLSADDELSAAEHYAHDLLGDLNAGAGAWLDWNMLLDERGGPNHVGNYCAAAAFFDMTGGGFGGTCADGLQLTDTLAWVSHVTRFVRPGARVALVSRCANDVEATAAVNEDGSLVVVLLNRRGHDAFHKLCIAGTRDLPSRCAPLSLPARSITTLVLEGACGPATRAASGPPPGTR
ncbi:glycoside hydrolase family 30 beta sandwich domain-containing protein [Olsenella sp. HMSC062G07]|uniref:glycoside hydrolase family 30 protein n=1 Tax=Olsenella sp. HMSC062G07 TaxID=1739330 RepID=UPI0008A51303|nr:glycoside hydrolase family 30 beta sandwich domain-containing protein [Olsenella sp. HMSC062G07]OFK23720.1 hypothetical protein HMPREF2826_04295 [Olsenella sp. HMSC062G07]